MSAPTATPRPRRPRQRKETAIDSSALATLRVRAAEHSVTLPTDAPVVDLYARLSRNPEGHLEKIETQLADALRTAIDHGWRVGEMHIDNSLSAWNLKVRRPAWEAMLERLRTGACDGMVGYHFDRFTRTPQDMCRLLEIVRQRELKVATAHGKRNLNDPTDQFAAWIDVLTAQRASDDTSRRLRRNFKRMRESGIVRGGPRWFGFPGADRTAPQAEDGIPRPSVPAEQVERERAAIRQAAEGIAAGTTTLAEVAKAWNEACLPTATGGNWDGVNVRQVLARPRNAGLIYHQKKLVSRVTDEEPIVHEELHQQVQAVFAGRRRGRAPDTRNYVATGLIYCGVCGNPLTGRPRARYRPDGTQVTEYYCFKLRGGCGRLCVDARAVDAMLRDWTVRRLSDPAHAEQVQAAAAEDHKRLDEVTAELAQARMVETALAERLGRGEIGLDAWEVGNKHAHDRVVRLEIEREALAAKSTDPTDPELAASHKEAVAADWDHDASVNGTLRRALLTRALRGIQVVVEPRPHQKGKPVFDPTRVRIEPIRNA